MTPQEMLGLLTLIGRIPLLEAEIARLQAALAEAQAEPEPTGT